MGSPRDHGLGHWVDLVGDLVSGAPGSFPVDLVLRELSETFGVNAAWNWLEADGSFGFVLERAVPGWPEEGLMQDWAEGAFAEHPLVRWFVTTRDPTATTTDRVPREVCTDAGLRLVQDQLAPYDLDRQLAIPYRLGSRTDRAFVLVTTGSDFPDEAVLLARRIQPLLVLLARQTAVLGGGRGQACAGAAQAVQSREAAARAGVTGRELAVLRLLEQGLTADAMGRALGISTRTVHVHLSHLYAKLSVHDRLMAVHVARSAGLLAASEPMLGPAPVPPPVGGPGRTFAWQPGAGMVSETGAP
jgi:DNA-binding CsgD family transcriptional regulator